MAKVKGYWKAPAIIGELIYTKTRPCAARLFGAVRDHMHDFSKVHRHGMGHQHGKMDVVPVWHPAG